MAISRRQGNTQNSNKKVKMCTLNICGLSERSKLVINKYVDSEEIDILCLQETGTDDLSKLEIHNMSNISDTNKAANKGVALYVKKKHTLTKLDTISKLSRNLDSCWGLVVIAKKRYIIGNIYVKLNHKPAMNEVVRMLTAAEHKQREHKATGIIVTGDFNARHLSWGDKINNYYGNSLVEVIDNTKYSICTSETPTFLCSNGSSFIDLNIISNNLVQHVNSCRTDEEVELFSGSPNRGHVPLITELITSSSSQTNSPVIEKLDMSKMQWDCWTKYIEDRIEDESDFFESEQCPYTSWNRLNEIITQATDTHCECKRSSTHSKPYWSEALTSLSNNLRAARKSYIKRNTDINLQKLYEAKEMFDNERKLSCQNFLINTAKQLNAAQAQKFWKDFNKLFKKKSTQKVDPLLDENGELLTENDQIDQCLFSVFFEGKHLIEENFDDTFYKTINDMYDHIIEDDYVNDLTEELAESVDDLNSDITIEEILKAIKTSGKSVDNFKFHPLMFRHLGEKSITILHKLFNLCLKKHQWIWKGAEVIFLRKPGKDSYSKPGSYRPICITSYIGKLLEAIMTSRIELLLLKSEQTDPNQEGFSARKNTIRYLSRLHLKITAEKEKNQTIIGLFVDFEKAFDSVWKRGLMVKLHNLGVRGNAAKLINNFLFTREVTLNINGDQGNRRLSAEYGLPQGSVISPVLFKIYVMDLLSELNNNPNFTLLKFADDGTVIISAADSPTCVRHLNYVLECLDNWSKRWRLNINCDKNKTELICFNSAEGDRETIPNTFKLGNKEIHKVTETKVLGLVIDQDLTYKQHSEMVLRDLYARWATICKYTNKYWGFNQHVMIYLLKALFISKISYADHIWISKQNYAEINKLWYHMLKSITGAVLNIKQSTAEIILGLPPIAIQTKVHHIKHFLKIINTPVQNDKYKEFISTTYNHLTKEPSLLYNRFKDIFKFLEWKLKQHPSHFRMEDQAIVTSKNFNEFQHLSQKACTYTQKMMQQYTELVLWSSSMRNQFQLEGYPTPPKASCNTIPIPRNTPRKTEVQLLSLFYKNNLLNQSLYNLSRVPSPLCPYCGEEEETADHLLFRCDHVEEELRQNARDTYKHALNIGDRDTDPDIHIGLLSACKSDEFINSCIDIINCLDIRVTIEL
jgi:exonuclease III